jgi:hypothetical protein
VGARTLAPSPGPSTKEPIMFRFRRFLLLCIFCLPLAIAALGCEEKRKVYKETTVEPTVIKKDFIVE